MTPADQTEYVRYREIFKGIRLPLAFVDLDRFDRNIAYVASTQKGTGKTIRVHSKSLRCAALIKRIFEKGGDAYRGVMTFAVEETAYLAEQGLDDFIIAYPTVQPRDLDLMVQLTQAGKTVSLMIDSIEHLKILSAAGEKAGTVLHACLDVDLAYRPLKSTIHLGVRRSPVRTVAEAVAIAAASQKLKGVTIDAVMGYEAHIAGTNDDVPGKWWMNQVARRLKKASIREFTRRRGDIVQQLQAAGLVLRLVNGGGSGSLISTGKDPSVTEVTAGSAFYAPALFHYFKEVKFTPSAFFAIQVVRKPAPGLITCQGGGYVASGAAGKDKLPVPVYPKGLRLLPLEGAGEVQTPFLLPDDGPMLELGDPVFLQHAKSGELAERFNQFYLVQGDKITAKVKTYRGDGQAFI
jgi:D-serine deaminase-like pyridoxal phosphate-dependent protein